MMTHVDPHAFFIHPALSTIRISGEVGRVLMAGRWRLESAVVGPQLITKKKKTSDQETRREQSSSAHPRRLNQPFLLWLGRMGDGQMRFSFQRTHRAVVAAATEVQMVKPRGLSS
jgi:hypothetical protein